MAKYKIKHTSIMHDGHLYKEGSTVELTKEQAQRLEDFVTLIPEKKSENSTNKTKTQNTNKTAAKTADKTKTETKTDVKEGEKNDK